jgi:hypothetical protein
MSLHEFRLDSNPDQREYPQTVQSIERAKREAAMELVEAEQQIGGLTLRQHAVLDAQEAIERLAAQLGSYQDLARLVRNLAAIHGEQV